MTTIPLIWTTYRGKEVVTIRQLEERLLFNGKSLVSRSSVYKFMKDNTPRYFTPKHDYFFYNKGSYEFKEFVDKYKHLEGAFINPHTEHLVTKIGVEKLILHWNVNPETLISEKEVPENAPKHGILFETPRSLYEKKTEGISLMDIFRNEKGLISKESEIPPTLKTRNKRTHRVYVRDFNADNKVVLGVNKELSLALSGFDSVDRRVKGQAELRAQFYIQDTSKGKALIIRFVTEESPNSITLHVTSHDPNEGATNIALRKTVRSKVVEDALDSAGLRDVETRQVELRPEAQSIIAYFEDTK